MGKNSAIYLPSKVDIIVTIFITVLLGYVGGLTWKNDVYYVFALYIIALIITNLNKIVIRKRDRGNEKQRKSYQKKHVDNPRSDRKKLPRELEEMGSSIDYDTCFEAMKLLLGMIVTIVLAIIFSVGLSNNAEFGRFVFDFYIDAFLFPMLLMLIEAFMYKQQPKQAICEFFRVLFFKRNGKLSVIKGVFGLVALVFFLIVALLNTMQEFNKENTGIAVRVIVFICGLVYLGYCFHSAAKQKKVEPQE